MFDVKRLPASKRQYHLRCQLTLAVTVVPQPEDVAVAADVVEALDMIVDVALKDDDVLLFAASVGTAAASGNSNAANARSFFIVFIIVDILSVLR